MRSQDVRLEAALAELMLLFSIAFNFIGCTLNLLLLQLPIVHRVVNTGAVPTVTTEPFLETK